MFKSFNATQNNDFCMKKAIETLYVTGAHKTDHVRMLTYFFQNVQFIHKVVLISGRRRLWKHKCNILQNHPLNTRPMGNIFHLRNRQTCKKLSFLHDIGEKIILLHFQPWNTKFINKINMIFYSLLFDTGNIKVLHKDKISSVCDVTLCIIANIVLDLKGLFQIPKKLR